MQSGATVYTEDLKVPFFTGIEGEDILAGSILSNEETLRYKLSEAHKKVRKNRSSRTPGTDGMQRNEFIERKESIIEDAIESLMYGVYTPAPMKLVEIPKSNGGMRQLSIPTLTDRMIHTVIKGELENHYEPLFYDSVHGFRPGRGPHSAIKRLTEMHREECPWVLQMDVRKMFDTIDQRKLLNLLQAGNIPLRVIGIVKSVLHTPASKGCYTWVPEKGVPQGSPLSPLLANVYMHTIDTLIARRGLNCIRYADDLTLVSGSRDAARRTQKVIEKALTDIGLEAHPDKTVITDIREKNVVVLGFEVDADNRVLVPEAKVREVMSRIDQACSAGGHLGNDLRRGTYNYVKGIMSCYRRVDDYEPIKRIKAYALEKLNIEGGDLYEYRDLM